MMKDWNNLKRLMFEPGGEVDETQRCLEKEAPQEPPFSDERTLAAFLAVQPTPDERTLMKTVCHYTDDQLQKNLLLYNCFSDWTKALIVGLEALKRNQNEPYLLTLCLRAARHTGCIEIGRQLLARLICDIPRDQMDCDGYLEAIRFLLLSENPDHALCRELLGDYHARFPDDLEHWLLLSELECALGNDAAASAALKTVFDRMPPGWKACGEAPSPGQLKEMVDRCYEAGRDYAREHELHSRAWRLKRRMQNHERSENV